jgi:SUMO ligase MMS21 Smc5/6 complex component
MNNQFGLGEVLSSLKPELIRFQALLEEIPESYFETATPAAEIRNNENNEDINDIYETAQLITNTFSKLDLVERDTRMD